MGEDDAASCTHQQTRVTNTRRMAGDIVRRQRTCRSCGARWSTTEAPEIETPKPRALVGHIRLFSDRTFVIQTSEQG